jgi:hypothetical protein
MSDGVSVYECTSPDEVVDLLASGQGVFGIAIGRLLQKIAGELAKLPRARDADDSQFGDRRAGTTRPAEVETLSPDLRIRNSAIQGIRRSGTRVSLAASGREASAEVAELSECDGQFVAELVVVLAELAVGVVQGPDDGLVGPGADPLGFRQGRAAL